MDQLEQLRQAALDSLKSAGSGGDDAPWHRWDDGEVAGTYIGTESFTRKDGETATFARVLTANGEVKMGLDYAALKREWTKQQPQPGDMILVMRGDEKATSNNGREYWPFGLSVQPKQQALEGVVVMEDQVSKPTDPDNPDDIPF
jgi:hypothetical protein